jgi:hypothetical protein
MVASSAYFVLLTWKKNRIPTVLITWNRQYVPKTLVYNLQTPVKHPEESIQQDRKVPTKTSSSSEE